MIDGAGAGPKEMALKIAIAHSRATKITESLGGGMAALGCDEATALELIDRVLKGASESVLEVGCHNSLEAVVITGSSALTDEVVSLASIANIFVQRVQTLDPFRSSMTEVCKEEYLGNVKAVFEEFPDLHNPTIPCYSTVVGHGKFIEQFTADYLWENLRNPVHFHQAISSILKDHPDAVFIEISPPPCPLFLCLGHWCLVRSGGVPIS